MASTGMHTEVHIPLADIRVIKIRRIFFFLMRKWLGMVAHVCPATQETEAGKSMFRPYLGCRVSAKPVPMTQ